MRTRTHMLSCFLLLLFLVPFALSKKLILRTNSKSYYNTKDSCPTGYRLAILDSQEDWNTGTQLALQSLGYNSSVWIRFGLGWRGQGNERWSIITPTPPNSCEFPPKDLDSFCVQFDHFRLSPSWEIPSPQLPSICEEINQS